VTMRQVGAAGLCGCSHGVGGGLGAQVPAPLSPDSPGDSTGTVGVRTADAA
jgi:hypothetical protein